MLERVLAEFLRSGAGAEALMQLHADGFTREAARDVMSATTEGALQRFQATGSPQFEAAVLPNSLDGDGTTEMGAIVGDVVRFVAERTRMTSGDASRAVTIVLPKLLSMLQAGEGQPAASRDGGLGGMFGSLK